MWGNRKRYGSCYIILDLGFRDLGFKVYAHQHFGFRLRRLLSSVCRGTMGPLAQSPYLVYDS